MSLRFRRHPMVSLLPSSEIYITIGVIDSMGLRFFAMFTLSKKFPVLVTWFIQKM